MNSGEILKSIGLYIYLVYALNLDNDYRLKTMLKLDMLPMSEKNILLSRMIIR